VIAEPLDSLRLFIHILGATIWVGGQLTLAGLITVLRSGGEDLPKRAANAFNRIAWPAYVLLILSGGWNLWERYTEADQTWWITLTLKVILVALSGVAAYLHTKATSRKGLALWGALSGLSALGALYVGVLLSGAHGVHP
jgi:putative copper export protein